jgi:hypothetical protein
MLVIGYRLKRRMSRIFLICIFNVVIILISPNHRRLRIAWHQQIPHQDYRYFLESSYKVSVAIKRLFLGLTIKSLAERMLVDATDAALIISLQGNCKISTIQITCFLCSNFAEVGQQITRQEGNVVSR